MPRSTPLALLSAASLLVACGGDGTLAPYDTHFHGPPQDEIDQIAMPVTCAASIAVYPIAGPHNGGWDSNATSFSCAHPSNAGDNSDFIGGDHYGNDLFAAEGTPAVAPVSGVISHSGYGTVSGNRVTIRDACGWHYFLGHLETIRPGMSVGTNVTAGQLIGTVGDTGNAAGTQAHIHFSVYPESYNSGIDPFPLLQNADHSNCDGTASGGGTSPTINPCTNQDIVASEDSGSFNFLYGGAGAATSNGAAPGPGLPDTGGLDNSFRSVLPYSAGADFTVGRWGPWISHTGIWDVEAYIPASSVELSSNAVYEIAFQGGRAVAEVDQEASKGSWVSLLPEPLKFVVGVAGYVGLHNATMPTGARTDGAIAFDSVRWVFIGPEGSGGVGSSCDLSVDCMGNLICGEGSTCETPCDSGACGVGACDVTTGICSLPSEGEPLEEPIIDTDGDGIPNYLEGPGDPDGDGIPSWYDGDSDNDGILDSVEGSGDSDNDGILDSQDTDSDNDGIPDADEVGDYDDMPLDSDLDGIPDFQDADSDNDGIPDAVEVGGASPPPDTDNDGIPDHLDTDSDNDGLTDGEEAGYEPSNPTDSDEDGVPDYLEAGDAAFRAGGSPTGGLGGSGLQTGDGTDFGQYGCSAVGGVAPSLWLVGLGLIAGVVGRRRRG